MSKGVRWWLRKTRRLQPETIIGIRADELRRLLSLAAGIDLDEYVAWNDYRDRVAELAEARAEIALLRSVQGVLARGVAGL